MKRTIQCPNCQAKLAVFDTGKPINQKCPRCGNAFEVPVDPAGKSASKPADTRKSKKIETAESPEAATATAAPESQAAAAPVTAAPQAAPAPTEPAAPAADTPPASPAPQAAPAADAVPQAPSPAPDAAKPDTPADQKKPDAAPATPEKKEIAVKKPLDRPAGAAPRPSAPTSAAPAAETPPPADHGVTFLHIMVLFFLVIVTIVGLVITNIQTKKRLTRIEDAIRYLQTHKK